LSVVLGAIAGVELLEHVRGGGESAEQTSNVREVRLTYAVQRERTEAERAKLEGWMHDETAGAATVSRSGLDSAALLVEAPGIWTRVTRSRYPRRKRADRIRGGSAKPAPRSRHSPSSHNVRPARTPPL